MSSTTTVVEDLVRASLSPAPPMDPQQILESSATAEAMSSGRRGTDPLTKLFLSVPGTSVKCETTRKKLQQTSEVRHSREDLLLHPQEVTNPSPATERRQSKMKDLIDEHATVRETSSVAILGKKVQRQFRSVFRLPDGLTVAVRREESYSPEENHLEVRAFLSTACPANVKYGGGGAQFWRKARKPAAITDFLKDNELANSLFSYTVPLDVELARVQAAAERDSSPRLRRNSLPTPSDQETPPRNHSAFLDEEDTTPTETDFTTEEFEEREEEWDDEEEEDWEGEEDEFGTTI